MNFIFRGARADIGNSFQDLQRRLPNHAAIISLKLLVRDNANPLILLFIVLVALLLVLVLNTDQLLPVFLVWLVYAIFMMTVHLRFYAKLQQIETQSQSLIVAASDQLQMPPSAEFASRRRMLGLRLQLTLFNREINDLDYEMLRALDEDNVPAFFSLSEEQINALPVHMYITGLRSGVGALQKASSLSSHEKQLDILNDGRCEGRFEDELTCSICLEQVNLGELIRTLPCFHQYHTTCIDPWLRQQGTCPLCKFKVLTAWHEEGHGDAQFSV